MKIIQMHVLSRISSLFYKKSSQLTGWLLFSMVIVYLLISWVLFFIAGEHALVGDWVNFIYFASTTASTVGYGDISPSTTEGRLVAALWFFPGAVLIFTAILSKLAGFVLERVRRMSEGLGDFDDLKGATVIIGYQAERTSRMISDIFAGQDDDKDIVILSDHKNVQIPEGVQFVHSERLDAKDGLHRAAIRRATKVLVYTDTDAQTFNVCLAVREINSDAVVAAYFLDRNTASRAEKFANIRAIVSTSTEMLVRAVQDPGAGLVLMALSAAGYKSTIYSGLVSGSKEVRSSDLEEAIRESGATLVAVGESTGLEPTFSPFPKTLKPGAIIFYIAEFRLDAATWADIIRRAR
jgi:voltage-gated potassium channel